MIGTGFKWKYCKRKRERHYGMSVHNSNTAREASATFTGQIVLRNKSQAVNGFQDAGPVLPVKNINLDKSENQFGMSNSRHMEHSSRDLEVLPLLE
jgi:hypothetical protein